MLESIASGLSVLLSTYQSSIVCAPQSSNADGIVDVTMLSSHSSLFGAYETYVVKLAILVLSLNTSSYSSIVRGEV